jgi:hypothetical protein
LCCVGSGFNVAAVFISALSRWRWVVRFPPQSPHTREKTHGTQNKRRRGSQNRFRCCLCREPNSPSNIKLGTIWTTLSRLPIGLRS